MSKFTLFEDQINLQFNFTYKDIKLGEWEDQAMTFVLKEGSHYGLSFQKNQKDKERDGGGRKNNKQIFRVRT